MRAYVLIGLIGLTVAACNTVQPTGPAGQPSSNAVNPQTGSRAGSGSSH